MTTCDAHCHFLSTGLFRALGAEIGVTERAETALPARLGWEAPGESTALAGRWVTELDRHGVARAVVIASVPGDEMSVAEAVRAHPGRLVGAFQFNPMAADPARRLDAAFQAGLSTVCLFPAMHHYRLDEPAVATVFERAMHHRRVVFVHCGVLALGFRQKLGLASRFDLRLGDPLAVAVVAQQYPTVPVVIPHFGAGLFREALMAAHQAPNLLLDTSSSNRWIAYHPALTLREVFARALDIVGPTRILFGTDSSFFPRGWQTQVRDDQVEALSRLGMAEAVQAAIFGGNFQRIYPLSS